MEPRPNANIHVFYSHVSHNIVKLFALQSSGPKTGSKNALDPKLVFHSYLRIWAVVSGLELLTTVIPVVFSVSVFLGIRYSRYRYFSVGIVVL